MIDVRLIILPLVMLSTGLLPGCTEGLILQAATYNRGEDKRVDIQLSLETEELQKVYDEKYYYHIYIFECEGDLEQYPARPLIDGQPVASFGDFSAQEVQLSAQMPSKLFENLSEPCVQIRGATYLGESKISSNIVKILSSSD